MTATKEFHLVSRGDGDLKHRYRPQRLSEFVPTAAITRLQRMAKEPKSQVYLFEGPSGTGKTSAARIIARAAICEAKENKPCLECDSCKTMERSGDFQELNIADLRKIDDIRDIIAEMRFKPMILKRKIYILDEVHQLTADAQQALLKTFEEPHPGLLIFMCTTETKGLDKALIDRAEKLTFRALTADQAAEISTQVTKTAGTVMGEGTPKRLFETSGGSARALLNAIDAMLDGEAPAAESAEEDAAGPDVSDLAKALMDGDWRATVDVLKRPSVKAKPESVRIGAESYVRAVLFSKGLNSGALNALEKLVGTLSMEPAISQYNRLVYKCAKACQQAG